MWSIAAFTINCESLESTALNCLAAPEIAEQMSIRKSAAESSSSFCFLPLNFLSS